MNVNNNASRSNNNSSGNNIENKEQPPLKYIVMRNNYPITLEGMPIHEAEEELKRWEAILKKWPDGTKVRLEVLNNQLNRT